MAELYRDPEIERLIQELNQRPGEGSEVASEVEPRSGPEVALSEAPGRSARPLERPRLRQVEEGGALETLLVHMLQAEASDLLLLPGEPPILRIHGALVRSELAVQEGAEIRRAFEPHLGGLTRRRLAADGAADFSLSLVAAAGSEGLEVERRYRFRVNLHRQRGAVAAAVRALSWRVPTLEDLHLPESLADLVEVTRGLVLVTGAAGAGKSSTLAALVDRINRHRAAHIITIEDPIEFEHRNHRSMVEQVEIGADSPSFAKALRAALRQDPDVILVGELRDLETVATALTAAETGHLILATVHTNDAMQAVHRLVDIFGSDRQNQIRQQLALALTAVISQQLAPRADGSGRVPALEILRATYPIRHHIRSNQMQKLYNELTLGRSQGMLTMEESLLRLVRAGAIRREEALARTTRPEEMESLLGSP